VPARRRLSLIALVAGLVLGIGVAVAYLVAQHRPGDVSHPEVRFLPDAPPVPKPSAADRFEWPLFGYSEDHTRVFRARLRADGRWRLVWRQRASALLEFPPVIYRGAIFQLADDGMLVSLARRTGRRRWRRRVGSLAASSPAVGAGSIYVTVLERARGSGHGQIVALNARNGRVRWSRNLPSRSESSPLLHRGRLYFGSEDGTLYRLNAHNGRVLWRYRASGAIKASPTLVHGKLYFGDYGGHVQAVQARNGRRVWDNAASIGLLHGGTFYATAAVAFGRVYVGGTDGRQYSFSSRDGRLAWAHQTRGYVYSSPAVQDVPGLGPTVFFGSYAGTFYALDARSGAIRWTYRVGGRLSGSPTIIGGTVFFADLEHRVTIGLRTSNGRPVFRRRPGAFDPVISDGRRLFLTGTSSLQALLPARHARRPKSSGVPPPPPRGAC
jgi:outer membrane protein assembly factor BamB